MGMINFGIDLQNLFDRHHIFCNLVPLAGPIKAERVQKLNPLLIKSNTINYKEKIII